MAGLAGVFYLMRFAQVDSTAFYGQQLAFYGQKVCGAAKFQTLFQVRKSWDTAILVLLLAVLILASLTTEGFLTALNFSYIFSNTSEITIIAFAMLFMIIMGEIDLSVASILALGSAMLGWSYAKGAPIWLSIIICILVGTLCGLVNGFLVTKLGLGSLAVTIGTLALYRGIANGILGENTVNEFPEFWTSFGFDTFGTSFMPKTMPLIIFFGKLGIIKSSL